MLNTTSQHFHRYLNLDLATDTSTESINLIRLYHLWSLYRNLDQHRNHQNIYQNFSMYTAAEDLYVGIWIPSISYRLFSAANRDQFDLKNQFDEERTITLFERMEQMKILKGVDLQRMVQRFNAQRKYIEGGGKGESVEPPAESIHDTWLSVLGITDEMLAISREEMENYIQYLRAVELIVACKEAAGRVSPKVWQRIEDRFLTVDAEGFEG